MKKTISFLTIFNYILLSFSFTLLVVNLVPLKKVVDANPFIMKDNQTMLAAHRGGSGIAPENTLLAFKTSIENYGVDIIETDLYLTRDNKLVLCHNETINSTSDVEIVKNSNDPVYIKDLSLAELSLYNFGYNFVASETFYGEQVFPAGSRPFRNICDGIENANERLAIVHGNEVGILDVEKLFEAFYYTQPQICYIVEIKDSGSRGMRAADFLARIILNKFPLLASKVVIGTFHPEIEKHLKKNYSGKLFMGASVSGASAFVLTQMFKVNLFYSCKFQCLQLPIEESTSVPILGSITINLLQKQFINQAHKRNIAVQYWTINDEATMRKAIELGADCIMTDYPDLFCKVKNDINQENMRFF